MPKAPRTAAASQAPRHRPPMATTSGPKRLRTMARRQACRCDCGINWVLREQRQGGPENAWPAGPSWAVHRRANGVQDARR
eukprot:7043397-Lingulodinium_polyedra.AAC.1